jgi:Putative Ig domain
VQTLLETQGLVVRFPNGSIVDLGSEIVMKTVEWIPRSRILWRVAMQFSLFLATSWVFAAPKPNIDSISPDSTLAGSSGFTLTVIGSDFDLSSEVDWNGSARPTTFNILNPGQLLAMISASDIAVAGRVEVTVKNSGPKDEVKVSKAVIFTVLSRSTTPLTITTAATLPGGLLNSAYSQSLSASGGTPPYTWDTTSGSLPPGLSLTSDGTLSGTLTSSGIFSFTVRVRDSAQPKASTTKKLTLTVSNPVPSISGINPSSADAGDPGFTLTVNGSNFVSGATVRWNGSDRTTTFNSATKLTASIPASDIVSAGAASITVNNPTPGGGSSNALSFTISPPPAPPPLTITSSSPLPDGVVAAPYSQALSASGGTPPYQWSVSSGALPPSLSLTPGTGVLSGTPSAAGDFSFALQVSDSTQPTRNTVTKTFNLRINNPVPAITSLNPSSANAGGSGFTLTVNGSNFTPDSMVNWNGASRSTSFISSTQLTSSISAGDIAVVGTATVVVRNPSPGGGTSNPLPFSISRFVAPLTITSSSSLPDGFVGSAYSQTLSASGGTPPYMWSMLTGSLPAGLTLSSSAGTISGTTSVSGTFNFSVRVRDNLSVAADKSFQLPIKPPLPAISIAGPADPLAPAQQPTLEISLAETYPSLLSGQMTLTFTPDADVPSDDPAIQFSTGGRAVDFTIPANSAKAVFPNSATSVAFQSGTVAGTIKMSIAMQNEGKDVTPSPVPTRTFTVNRSAPILSRLSIASRTTSGFDVELVGFSTPRSLTQVVFRFTPRAGSNLGTSTSTVPLGSSSATWFQSDTSKQFGSLFRLVIPFAVQGDVNAIQSVSATLANAEGTSDALSTTP